MKATIQTCKSLILQKLCSTTRKSKLKKEVKHERIALALLQFVDKAAHIEPKNRITAEMALTVSGLYTKTVKSLLRLNFCTFQFFGTTKIAVPSYVISLLHGFCFIFRTLLCPSFTTSCDVADPFAAITNPMKLNI